MPLFDGCIRLFDGFIRPFCGRFHLFCGCMHLLGGRIHRLRGRMHDFRGCIHHFDGRIHRFSGYRRQFDALMAEVRTEKERGSVAETSRSHFATGGAGNYSTRLDLRTCAADPAPRGTQPRSKAFAAFVGGCSGITSKE